MKTLKARFLLCLWVWSHLKRRKKEVVHSVYCHIENTSWLVPQEGMSNRTELNSEIHEDMQSNQFSVKARGPNTDSPGDLTDKVTVNRKDIDHSLEIPEWVQAEMNSWEYRASITGVDLAENKLSHYESSLFLMETNNLLPAHLQLIYLYYLCQQHNTHWCISNLAAVFKSSYAMLCCH